MIKVSHLPVPVLHQGNCGASLVVQRLVRLCASNAGHVNWIPGLTELDPACCN